jgi:hypothetical protein
MKLFRCIFGRNKLVDAIMLRHWEEVQMVIARRPRKARLLYRIMTKNGATTVLPLYHCLMLDAPCQVIRQLVRAHPVSLFLCESLKKRYPLHIACEAAASHHNYKVIITLLDAAPDLNMVRDKSGSLPLHHAVSNKAKFEVIAALLNSSDMAATQPDSKGWYPLHLACARELPYSIIQELIVAWPAAVLKTVDGSRTPADIIYAGNSGDKPSILILLQEEVAELESFPSSLHSMVVSVANCAGRIVL